MLCLASHVAAEEEPVDLSKLPGIYIERSVDNSQFLVPGLQAQYTSCLMVKHSRQEAMQKYPYIWESMKETVEPGYDVAAAAQPEPDWGKLAVGKFREEEFFFGNKYARYSYQANYAISEDDGLCQLQVTEIEKQDLDNGLFRYLVHLEDRLSPSSLHSGSASKVSEFRKQHVQRMTSPLVGRRQSNNDLAVAVEQYPEILGYLNKYLDDGSNRVPGVKRGISQGSVDKVKEGFGVKDMDKGSPNIQLPRSGDEHIVLGFMCDIAEANPLSKGRVWYWQKLHNYPTIMQRPIILKAERTMGKLVSVKVATRFERRATIADTVFDPPPGIKVEKDE